MKNSLRISRNGLEACPTISAWMTVWIGLCFTRPRCFEVSWRLYLLKTVICLKWSGSTIPIIEPTESHLQGFLDKSPQMPEWVSRVPGGQEKNDVQQHVSKNTIVAALCNTQQTPLARHTLLAPCCLSAQHAALCGGCARRQVRRWPQDKSTPRWICAACNAFHPWLLSASTAATASEAFAPPRTTESMNCTAAEYSGTARFSTPATSASAPRMQALITSRKSSQVEKDASIAVQIAGPLRGTSRSWSG